MRGYAPYRRSGVTELPQKAHDHLGHTLGVAFFRAGKGVEYAM